MATKKTIKVSEMSDTGILVTEALNASKQNGECKEDWEKVAEIYTLYKKEVADALIEEQFSDEYLLDIESCREYLMGEEECKEAEEERKDREAPGYISTLDLFS